MVAACCKTYDADFYNAEVAGGAAGVPYLGGVKLIADEVNSVSGSHNMQSTSLVNGLFIADAIGAAYDTTAYDGFGGFQGFSVWDLHNSYSTSTEAGIYGWRQGGDYGILGAGGNSTTPPISDNNNEPYPGLFFAGTCLDSLCIGRDHRFVNAGYSQQH